VRLFIHRCPRLVMLAAVTPTAADCACTTTHAEAAADAQRRAVQAAAAAAAARADVDAQRDVLLRQSIPAPHEEAETAALSDVSAAELGVLRVSELRKRAQQMGVVHEHFAPPPPFVVLTGISQAT
jgi:hypothetical protein